MHVEQHGYEERGTAALCAGRLRLVHGRTRRVHRFAYAAVHLGDLDVVGACRPAGDEDVEAPLVGALLGRWARGERLTSVLRDLTDTFGPSEFGLSAALPGAEARILTRVAHSLSDRFSADFARLLIDHRRSLLALAEAGYPLPAELRAPVELALGRRERDDLMALAHGDDRLALQSLAHTLADAEDAGVRTTLPGVREAATSALEALVARAVETGDEAAADAVRLLELLRSADIDVGLDRAQECIYERAAGRPQRRAPRPRVAARPGRRPPRRAPLTVSGVERLAVFADPQPDPASPASTSRLRLARLRRQTLANSTRPPTTPATGPPRYHGKRRSSSHREASRLRVER